MSKSEAIKLRDEFRTRVRDGTYPPPAAPETGPGPSTADGVSFDNYARIFLRNCPIRKGKNKGGPRVVAGDDGQLRGNDVWLLNRLVAAPGADDQPLGPRPIGTITQADIERAMASFRARGRASSTRNKYLVLLRLMSRWGLRKGYLSRSWFTDADEDSPNLTREKGKQRDRRIEPSG